MTDDVECSFMCLLTTIYFIILQDLHIISYKKKLTVTRGEVGEDNQGERGKHSQDTWTKPRGLRVVVGKKWGQLYLNNNKNK